MFQVQLMMKVLGVLFAIGLAVLWKVQCSTEAASAIDNIPVLIPEQGQLYIPQDDSTVQYHYIWYIFIGIHI